ncbi:MAG: hypothetical protein HF973_19880 [Chloroflexi bacterium]|nr:hypothetical protein [Chloroflexota bacterium]
MTRTTQHATRITHHVSRITLLLGFTAVFIGYLTVWLPGPAAGLQFLGVELGEWAKFLGMNTRRNLFYLPPITLSLMLLTWTVVWDNRSWQTWVMRGLAAALALLDFPALEDLLGPVRAEYLPRVGWIGLTLVWAAVVSLASWRWRERPWAAKLTWLLLLLLGLMGAIIPTQVYLEVRPFVANLLGMPLGIGPGVWLNAAGHLLVAIISGVQLYRDYNR